MKRMRFQCRGAFTLLEVSLVIGILAVLAALAMPSFMRRIKREQLPASARRLRSLIGMVRANAAYDGMRYRIRFPYEEEQEEDHLGGDRQPLIEREDEPIDEPEIFNPVTAPWAIGTTLLDEVWCAEVRLGKPTIEKLRELRERRSQLETELEAMFEEEDIEPERPPLYVEPDGTCEWATVSR
jgi:prepilin-type N-terminal cleavage/methylation domain-containing protein